MNEWIICFQIESHCPLHCKKQNLYHGKGPKKKLSLIGYKVKLDLD